MRVHNDTHAASVHILHTPDLRSFRRSRHTRRQRRYDRSGGDVLLAVAGAPYDTLLGAIGVPVFSGFRGGFGVLIGPTGGYIAGFLGAALVYWLLTARKNTTARKIAGMAVGMFVCYLFGTLWYVFATGVGLAGFIAATAKCVLPFIVPDAMKCVLAFWLAKKIRIKK